MLNVLYHSEDTEVIHLGTTECAAVLSASESCGPVARVCEDLRWIGPRVEQPAGLYCRLSCSWGFKDTAIEVADWSTLPTAVGMVGISLVTPLYFARLAHMTPTTQNIEHAVL